MIIGLFAKSTIGFGTVNVRGRSLVPYPPTRINAFMVARLGKPRRARSVVQVAKGFEKVTLIKQCCGRQAPADLDKLLLESIRLGAEGMASTDSPR